MRIKNFEVGADGKVTWDSSILVDGNEISLSAEGMVFLSQSELFKRSDGLTFLMKPHTDQYVIASFTIEKAAKSAHLAFNLGLLGNQAIKIAIVDVQNNRIFYVEDKLPQTIDFNRLKAAALDVKQAVKSNRINEEQASNLALSESWYFSLNVEKVPLNLAPGVTAATSPVGGVPATVFTTPGSGLHTFASGGYYYKTVTVNAETNDRVTRIIRWSHIANAPNSCACNRTNGETQIVVQTDAEYYYVAAEDKIILNWQESGWRLQNAKLRFGFGTGSITDILVNVTRSGYSGDSAGVKWSGAAKGLLDSPYYLFSTPAAFFNTVQFQDTYMTNNERAFHDQIGDQIIEEGNVVRAFKVMADSPLKDEGDYLKLSYTMTVPMDADADKHWGEKRTMYYGYQFDIQEKAWNTWRDMVTGVSHSTSRTYTLYEPL